jgi:hypothetical protein
MGYYKTSFEAFNNLFKKITLFFNPSVSLVRPQVEIKKIVTTVIYRLADGTSATHMADWFNWFNVEASTMKKYVDIVCDALCDKNKMLNKYVSIPSGDRLQKL